MTGRLDEAAERLARYDAMATSVVSRHPRGAARALAEHRDNLERIQKGELEERPYETAVILEQKIEAYEGAFEEAERCEDCGTPLADPLSIKRGVGPDCWDKRERAKLA